MTMWLLVDLMNARETTAISICCGAVTGLIAMTPGAGYITVGGGMCTGLIVAAICNPVMHWMDTKRDTVNDVLDVFSFHGECGRVTLLTWLCADAHSTCMCIGTTCLPHEERSHG